MTSANGTSNARTARKTLADQIDRLDDILDGLAEALNESIADAVRDVIGQAVREAVGVAIRVVLSNPELLRAALGKDAPPASASPPLSEMKTPLKDLLRSAGSSAGRRATQAAGKLGHAWRWCLAKVRQGCAGVLNLGKRVLARCAYIIRGAVGMSRSAWRFRQTCSMALAADMVSGVGSYLAGPVIASLASGIVSAALAVSASALLALGRLIAGNANSNT